MKNFAFALVAQFILATVNSLALAACSTVAEVWFPQNEAVLSTTFSSLANFIGVGIGLILPPLVADTYTTVIIEAAFGLLVLLLYIFLGRRELNRVPHVLNWLEIKTYILDCRKISVLLMAGSAIGTSYTLIGLYQQILSDYNYSTIQSGWAGVMLVAGGMLGGLVATLAVAKYNTFVLPLRVYIVIAIIAGIVQCFVLEIFGLYLFLSLCFGFGLIGFVPLAVRGGVEDAYPLDESIPTNVMFTSAQAFSLAYTYPILYFQSGTEYSGLWGIALCTVISFVPLFIVCGMKKTKEQLQTPKTDSVLTQILPGA